MPRTPHPDDLKYFLIVTTIAAVATLIGFALGLLAPDIGGW